MPPVCAHCGKPIKKRTRTVRLEQERSQYHRDDDFSRHIYPNELGVPWPTTIAECRKLTNHQVAAVSYGKSWVEGPQRYSKVRTDLIDWFSEWDGESYAPRYGFFCSGTCAAYHGRNMVVALNKIKEEKRGAR